MLSQNQMELARKCIEKTYIGTCSIITHKSIKKANGATANEVITKYENVSCRLIFINTTQNIETETIGVVKQIIQLHLAPEIIIKPGSKVIVTQNGKTTEYKASGESAAMLTHQEVKLEIFKGWS